MVSITERESPPETSPPRAANDSPLRGASRPASKKFVPSPLSEKVVPLVLVLLVGGLLAVLLMVVLAVLGVI
jgi:hypothetical protein